MRIPKTLQAKIQIMKEAFLWDAILIEGGHVQLKYYDNGEAIATTGTTGKSDYYLFSISRQQRIVTFKRAGDLWDYVWQIAHRGGDTFGLAQLD